MPSRAKDIPKRLKAELVEVAGQKKLLKWTVPGMAHFFTMWGFTILILTIIEAFGCLFQRDFHIPIIGRWEVIGFLEDFFAVAVLLSLATFVAIRVKHSPKRENRRSRFFGSHTGAAWLVLLAISGVIISLLLYRAAQVNTGNFPYGWGAFASHGIAELLHPLGTGVNSVIETTALLVNIAIIMGFLVFVAYSKHLHIFLAPINVATSRTAPGARRARLHPGHVHGGRRRRRRGRVRRRSHRGLLLEAAAGHGHLHRVRALPVAVPGLEHRQAPVAEAPDHGPARQHVRQRRPDHAAATAPTGQSRSRASSPRDWSSTPTSCGRAPPAAPASSSARWTSSTSTPSSTCAATRS